MISDMPSVAISGLTSSRAMTSPLIRPITAPMARTAAMAGSIMAGLPFMTTEVTTAAAEMTLATLRSIEATRMAKVCPMAVMPRVIERPRMATRFSRVRKRVWPSARTRPT